MGDVVFVNSGGKVAAIAPLHVIYQERVLFPKDHLYELPTFRSRDCEGMSYAACSPWKEKKPPGDCIAETCEAKEVRAQEL